MHEHEHDHDHHVAEVETRYRLRDFLPLITVFVLIIIFVSIRQLVNPDFFLMEAMQDFMAGFFLTLGFLKIINLKGFVEAYRTYDIVAKKSQIYAYIYPFIEISLGILFLFRLYLVQTNIITILVMSLSAIGVFQELSRKNQIVCACLGAVFKVPMTWVTLFEDLLMATMAVIMLLLL